MSYQVLARKWRPGKFSELVGQEHVVAAISNALDNNRLHHAYLFTGTRGVGKTTIARIFSKSLNCEQGQSSNPCGQCSTCREIEQGNYVDLLEIDAASRTKVEDTRELLDNVQYKPTRGRFKVYLIDEVHMLSKHSFNALLKTLEEPPPHVKFLLATTDPQKLPITILSRCLQFNLKALSREQISGQLTHILNQESIDFEAPALNLLARAAQGSMRDALSLTDQAIAQGDNQVTATVVTDMLGLMDRHQLLKILNAIVQRSPQKVLEQVALMAEQAPDYSQVLAELSSLLHQIALTQWVPDACKLETTSAKAIYQLARQIPSEQVQLLYQIALQGRKDMPFASDGRSGLEMVLLRMMTFAPVSPIQDRETVISENTVAVLPLQQLSAESKVVQDEGSSGGTSGEHADTEAAQDNVPPEVAFGVTEEPSVPAAEQAGEDTEHQRLLEEQAALEQQVSQSRREKGATFTPAEENTPWGSSMVPPDDVEGYMPPDGEEEFVGFDLASEQNTEQAPEVSGSSVAEMLALRQRLKQRREEASSSDAKKPLTQIHDPGGLAGRLAASSQQNSADSAIVNSTAEAEPAPESVGDIHSDESDRPPWVAETADINPANIHNEVNSTPPEIPPPESAETVHLDEQPVNASGTVAVLTRELPDGVPVELTAYLDDGNKLLRASQIDQWSALIESMDVAGLLKQIALHAAFSQNGSQVSLELDSSQAHLLNDSALNQLTDALRAVLGPQIALDIRVGEPKQTPFSLQQDINAMRQQYAEHVVQTDDIIQSIRNAFAASVMSDSVKAR
ncbi:DNA polymerase III subunit gamma/tau [Alteromonas aestuariivivens]|uniref:DNA polymerase III subunit gamma/tau n=1 Tax=Alteromonas aestuariivivens TaxID=1938339 RepID=A0A3D8M569_9ALTE|nr:DNA polymerase III subunit gamma/tau [Alteromonas aestuariivivens]RDV24684.1 DNA polymerase III subunit gamma/tau [Alteromonas aestuariivivens]